MQEKFKIEYFEKSNNIHVNLIYNLHYYEYWMMNFKRRWK